MAKDDLVLFSKEFDGVEHLIVKDEFGIDRDFIRPNNIMVISENNTYPVADCKQVDVQLPPQTGKKLQIAENGEFTPDTYSGEYYNEVVVNMATELTDEEITITENGTYKPSAGKMFSKVTVDVPCDTMVGYDEFGNPVTPYVDPNTGKLEITQLPDHINVTTPPTKTEYIPGDKIDYSGIIVTAYKKDGTIWDNPNYPDGVIPFNELIFLKDKLDGAIDNGCENIGVPISIKIQNAITAEGKNYDLVCFTGNWHMQGIETNTAVYPSSVNAKYVFNGIKEFNVNIEPDVIGVALWTISPYTEPLHLYNEYCYNVGFYQSSFVLSSDIVTFMPSFVVASHSEAALKKTEFILSCAMERAQWSRNITDGPYSLISTTDESEKIVKTGTSGKIGNIYYKYYSAEVISSRVPVLTAGNYCKNSGQTIINFYAANGLFQPTRYIPEIDGDISYDYKQVQQPFSASVTHDYVNDLIAFYNDDFWNHRYWFNVIAEAIFEGEKKYTYTGNVEEIRLMIYTATSDLDCGIEQPIKYSQCGKVVTDIVDNKHYVYLLDGMRFSIAYSQGKAGFYYVAASDQPRETGKITVRQLNNLNDNVVESEDVIAIIATTSFTHNDKTVYFTSGTINTKVAILGAAPVATDENAGLFRTHEGRIAWTIVFGNDENVDSYPCELPVQWKRPGDRKILEATTSVNVKLSRNVDTEL